ncbi:13035_t:CDS:2, partial [Racocetra persica]
MNYKCSIDSMSAIALMKSNLDKIIAMKYPTFEIYKEAEENDVESEGIEDYLIVQDENTDIIMNNTDFIRENSAVSKLNEYEISASNTNIAISSEDIPKNTTFNTWEEVEMFFMDYSIRNGFSIKKYRVEHTKIGVILKRTFSCEFSEKYKPNKIAENDAQIKLTTIANIHNHNLIPETRKFGIKYRSLSDEALKEVELMTKYRNLSITSQRNILRAPRDDDIIFNVRKVALNQDANNYTIPIRKSVTKLVTASFAKKKIYKRNQYGKFWGLARKATQLAVDNDDNEIVQFLTTYINRKKNEQMNKRILEQSAVTIQKDNQCDEQHTTNLNTGEVLQNDSELAQESEESESTVTELAVNLVKVQNPSKQKHKRGESSIRRSYKCRTCGQLGHNSAFHKNEAKSHKTVAR